MAVETKQTVLSNISLIYFMGVIGLYLVRNPLDLLMLP
jgi:hypothetical protein